MKCRQGGFVHLFTSRGDAGEVVEVGVRVACQREPVCFGIRSSDYPQLDIPKPTVEQTSTLERKRPRIGEPRWTELPLHQPRRCWRGSGGGRLGRMPARAAPRPAPLSRPVSGFVFEPHSSGGLLRVQVPPPLENQFHLLVDLFSSL